MEVTHELLVVRLREASIEEKFELVLERSHDVLRVNGFEPKTLTGLKPKLPIK